MSVLEAEYHEGYQDGYDQGEKDAGARVIEPLRLLGADLMRMVWWLMLQAGENIDEKQIQQIEELRQRALMLCADVIPDNLK